MQKTKQRYQAYKPTNIDWIGEIPVDWEVVKYNFLYKSAMGQTILKEDLFDDGGIPVYSATEEDKFFGYVNDAKVILNDGDLVIPARGNSIGHVKLVKNKSTTTQTTIYSKLLNRNLINSRFTAYLFKGLKNVFFFFDNTAIPQITVEQVKDNFLILPPLTEQQAIADYLDTKTAQIDQIISLKQQQIELLKERRTALINHVVTKGLDPNVEMVDSGIEWIGMIPKGWEVRKLKYVGKSIIGLTYSPEDITDESGILVLRSSNIQNGKLCINDNVYVNKYISNKLTVKKGDILICSRNGSKSLIGKSAVIDSTVQGASFGAFMTIFRSNNNNFIRYIFKSQIFNYQLSGVLTSTINQLTINDLNNIITTIPPINEQQSIADYLDSKTSQIDQTITAVEKSIELLTEYKQSLISHVVTGKVKVF